MYFEPEINFKYPFSTVHPLLSVGLGGGYGVINVTGALVVEIFVFSTFVLLVIGVVVVCALVVLSVTVELVLTMLVVVAV